MEDFMAEKRPVQHIRLPQRADAVGGQEKQPGKPLPAAPTPDPRTVSQEPASTSKDADPGVSA